MEKLEQPFFLKQRHRVLSNGGHFAQGLRQV
jgi:hypothetical protein